MIFVFTEGVIYFCAMQDKISEVLKDYMSPRQIELALPRIMEAIDQLSSDKLDLIAKTIKFIVDKYGFSLEDIKGYRRDDDKLLIARHCLYRLLYKEADMGVTEIGFLLNRTHGAIISGLKSLQNRIDTTGFIP